MRTKLFVLLSEAALSVASFYASSLKEVSPDVLSLTGE